MTKDATRKVKIEGRAFARVKAKVEALKEAQKEADKICKEAHDELWHAIHEEVPNFSKDDNLTLERTHEDLGFYVLKEKDNDGLDGLMAALAKAVK